MASDDLIIRNAHTWGTAAPADLAISGGVYVPPDNVNADSATVIDAGGRLCVPGFVEPHIHLDKVYLADSIPVNVSGSLDEAIDILGARKQSYSTEDIVERAGRMIRTSVANGVTRMRTHVDIDTGCGLTAFDAMLAVREQFADLLELQIVAFPQKGIVGDPGTEALLREAMERGADQIGGMPFNEPGPAESRAHIETAFDIAGEHDCDVDMHIDETDDPDARTLEMLAEVTLERGWQGRVIAGHTCALAAYPDDYADGVMDKVAEAGIQMITNPATNLMLQGREDSHPKRRGITRVKELLDRGVNVAFGQDNLQDMFYPFGRDDPLELCFLLAHAAHMSQPDEIEAVFAMPTVNAGQVMGLKDYGTEPGCVGDLVVLDAATPLEAIANKPDRRFVIRRGRVVAETETRRSFVG